MVNVARPREIAPNATLTRWPDPPPYKPAVRKRPATGAPRAGATPYATSGSRIASSTVVSTRSPPRTVNVRQGLGTHAGPSSPMTKAAVA